ncbi:MULTISPECIES: hypothetical protein [Rhizobium]|uniref:hypothetical protein n=1 Tax=Rhizobium TaxID=379 RepID=UPI001FE0522E|nr:MULTISPECIES: hypothetical protein [Rhizobium]
MIREITSLKAFAISIVGSAPRSLRISARLSTSSRNFVNALGLISITLVGGSCAASSAFSRLRSALSLAMIDETSSSSIVPLATCSKTRAICS